MPDRGACKSVDRKNLVRARHIKHPVRREWCRFEAEVLDWKHPFRLERGYVSPVDLLERAMAVSRKIPVITEPVAGLGCAPFDLARGFGCGRHDRLVVEKEQVSNQHRPIVGGQ